MSGWYINDNFEPIQTRNCSSHNCVWYDEPLNSIKTIDGYDRFCPCFMCEFNKIEDDESEKETD